MNSGEPARTVLFASNVTPESYAALRQSVGAAYAKSVGVDTDHPLRWNNYFASNIGFITQGFSVSERGIVPAMGYRVVISMPELRTARDKARLHGTTVQRMRESSAAHQALPRILLCSAFDESGKLPLRALGESCELAYRGATQRALQVFESHRENAEHFMPALYGVFTEDIARLVSDSLGEQIPSAARVPIVQERVRLAEGPGWVSEN